MALLSLILRSTAVGQTNSFSATAPCHSRPISTAPFAGLLSQELRRSREPFFESFFSFPERAPHDESNPEKVNEKEIALCMYSTAAQ